ncbi:MAG TPA: rhomboid family intramembrane serine protease [Gemmataceae bacterium]
MSEAGLNPLESILRMCAASAPEPWYPRLYAKQTGVDTRALGRCLEELWLDGLIEKKPGNEETGPAISLTREGERVLLDPETLRRLRAGEPLSSGDRGAVIRQALRGRLRPRITVLLVLLNVLVFAAGYFKAREVGADTAFLSGSPKVAQILENSGAMTARNLIDGQWWRLLTAGFVHVGFLHILMNMAFLYLAGRFIEQMWGHARYLVIYLVAILGGSVLAAAHSIGLFAGASGGVCGLLAAQAMWFLLNRRYLPRDLLRQARTNTIVNLILLVFISSFKDVSGWGHFGGAVAGAMAALLLQLQRFGPPVWRWLALVGFVPLAWYGQYAIDYARNTDPKWHAVEKQQFRDHYRGPILEATEKAAAVYDDEVVPVMETHPTRRDPAKVEEVLSSAAEQQRELNALAQRLAHLNPYGDPDTEAARQVGQEYLTATAELFAEIEHVLRLGDKRTDKEKRALQQQGKKVLELRDTWEELTLK